MTHHATATEIVRALYRAFEDGDHGGIRRLLAHDVAWRQAGTVVPAAGEDEIGADRLLQRVIRPIERDWTGFTEQVERLLETGDGYVVATGTYRGRHRRSGRHLEAEFCHLWRVEEGLITAFRQYTDTAAFGAAVGSGNAADG